MKRKKPDKAKKKKAQKRETRFTESTQTGVLPTGYSILPERDLKNLGCG